MSRAGAGDRVRRLLAIVPWVAARDGVPLDAICERFGTTRKELMDDLSTLSFVGVAPYTPDLLVEVVIEDEKVWVHLPQAFDRPLNLTQDEGLALLVAARAGGRLHDDDGPLSRAVAKLAPALGGAAAAEAIEVELGRADDAVVRELREALASRHAVEIDYYAYGRDARSTRVVEPHDLAVADGWWYLSGVCRTAGGERVFRVDRIQGVRTLPETFAEPAEPAVARPALSGTMGRVVLELEASAAWVAEHYPTASVEALGEGRLRVELPVTARPWLERLLLTIGPRGRVVDGPEELIGAGREAAARVLARYGAS